MTIKAVLRMGAKLLGEVAAPVTEFNSTDLDAIVQDMLDTMQHLDGAGIAAPQIGVSQRIIIFGIDHNPRYPDVEPVPLTVLINPEIEIIDDNQNTLWEGCLSVPGMRGLVARPNKIKYVGFDPQGTKIERVAEDFHARVVLHESDHLDGILYPQRIDDLSQFGFIEELEAAGKLPKKTTEDTDTDAGSES
ncbi:MAG: peptide deformylase [Gammaproteobacteria bacterium]|nr:peptide deformylase [Gammaproteobacteria bacterium]MDH5728014.1 peptide deformylase [Gammaproteobacteria bacterium]